jgi:hypothetical protein
MTEFTSQISATDAIGSAFNHTIKMLFKPFNYIKWLKLGLVAFLVSFSSGGMNFNFNMPFNDKSSFNMEQQLNNIIQWIQNNLIFTIIIGVSALLIITIIWTIIIYFSSRFSFVFLESVVKNNVQIKQYYKSNKSNGWSYFLWQMIFTPTALLIIMLITGIPAFFLVYTALKNEFTFSIILLLVLTGLVLIGLIILLAIISVFTADFALPIMYLAKIRITRAWSILLTLMRAHKGQFLLYLLMRIVLSMASMAFILVPCCLVGCLSTPFYLLIMGLVLLAFKYPLFWIAVVLCGLIIGLALSFVFQVVFLPATVFFRAYPLAYLEGFGPEFASISQNSSP